METIEHIKGQINSLKENEFDEPLNYMNNLKHNNKGNFFDNLKKISIDAPKDFSGNVYNYLYSDSN